MKQDSFTSGFVAGNLPEFSAAFSHVKVWYVSATGYSQILCAERNGKRHVLKTLKPEFVGNPVYVALLAKEFEIGYSLDHPNLCRVLGWEQIPDFGECIVMEYIDGETLDEWIAHNAVHADLARRLLCELCTGLNYLHQRQIIHRDLKPGNILVTHNGTHIKIIDFGFADKDNYTVFKEPAGTKHYASPEQLRGEKIDSRSDLYAVGGLIQDLFGEHPPRKYRKIAARCMRPNPQDRYADCEELLADLNRPNNRWPILGAMLLGVAIGGYGIWHFSESSRSEQVVDPAVSSVTDTLVQEPRPSQEQPVSASDMETVKPSSALSPDRLVPQPAPELKQEQEQMPVDVMQAVLVADLAYARLNEECRQRCGQRIEQITESDTPDKMAQIWAQDSLAVCREYTRLLDSLFRNIPDCVQKAGCYDMVKTVFDGDYCRSMYKPKFLSIVVDAYKRSNDRVADSLRINNPIRSIGIYRDTGVTNADSLAEMFRLQRNKDRENARIWYRIKNGVEL